ncbi:sigma-70 family RNA polymerase sigma factor [Stappia sp. MMSF_3263]|uniref:sigma-70 family RNA polymerase sigma factor n=1 Tax=Stappia sp. MMSF_3263 TaxID=3046693 RepID=UPI00273F7EE0|nr:sigma-70 family RNA polymerase sigma factor [Stappia sp. MMSF_3263]
MTLSPGDNPDKPRSATGASAGDDLAVLLARVAAGERAAFETLYARTSAKLFGVIVSICRDRSISEDVLQNAYVRIWRYADSFDEARARPISWLAAVARNAAIDELRTSARTGLPGALTTTGASGDGQGAEDGDILERLADQTEHPAPWDLGALRACLDLLETDQRRCVLYAYYEGYSREDLSERFDRPVGTIKTWLHRGLIALKACLGDR